MPSWQPDTGTEGEVSNVYAITNASGDVINFNAIDDYSNTSTGTDTMVDITFGNSTTFLLTNDFTFEWTSTGVSYKSDVCINSHIPTEGDYGISLDYPEAQSPVSINLTSLGFIPESDKCYLTINSRWPNGVGYEEISLDLSTFPFTVKIECNTPNASIYYTTNGIDPTTSSSLYTGTFNATMGSTIKAIGVKEGFLNSDIGSLKI